MRDEAFSTFVNQRYDEVVVSVETLTGDRDTARAAADEAFSRARQQWSRLSRFDDPRRWVRREAARVARGSSRADDRVSLDRDGYEGYLATRPTPAHRRPVVVMAVATTVAALVAAALVLPAALRQPLTAGSVWLAAGTAAEEPAPAIFEGETGATERWRVAGGRFKDHTWAVFAYREARGEERSCLVVENAGGLDHTCFTGGDGDVDWSLHALTAHGRPRAAAVLGRVGEEVARVRVVLSDGRIVEVSTVDAEPVPGRVFVAVFLERGEDLPPTRFELYDASGELLGASDPQRRSS